MQRCVFGGGLHVCVSVSVSCGDVFFPYWSVLQYALLQTHDRHGVHFLVIRSGLHWGENKII